MRKLDDLISKFREFSVCLVDVAGPDQTKQYNRRASNIGRVFDEICLHGESGFDAVELLLNDPKPWVRFVAGSCLLDHRTDAAVEALDKLAQQRGGVVNSQAGIHLFTWYYDRTGKYYEPGEKLEY